MISLPSKLTLTLIVGGALVTGCASTAANKATGVAQMQPTQGNQAQGTVTFTESSAGILKVQVRMDNVSGSGAHGLHIHQKGDCSAPDAESAGGHFNPASTQHGGRGGGQRHAGDFGNVSVNEGRIMETFDIEGITVDDSPSGIAGRSVILHAGADDLSSQPSGNSGARIACGVIRTAN